MKLLIDKYTTWWNQSLAGRITAKFSEDNLPAYSAQSAFFLFISIFPIIILTSTLIRYTPLTEETLIHMIQDIIPGVLGDTLITWVNEIYRGHPGYISFSIIFILWSASKSFIGIIDSLDNIFKPQVRHIRLFNRIRATVCTVLFIITIFIAGILLVFWSFFSTWIISLFPSLANLAKLVVGLRLLITVAVFIVILTLMYMFLTHKSVKFRHSFPGALFTSVGWIIFSYMYSVYIEHIANGSSVYGSITSIIFLMLWLYFCMYIFLAGAELNYYLFTQKYPSATETDAP